MRELGRIVRVPLELEWEEYGARSEAFEREFLLLSDLEDDPLGQWLRIAKAKGENRNSDDLTLKLLVALHHKIDTLTRLLQNETREYPTLCHKGGVDAMGHSAIVMQEERFSPGVQYYGRINLPVFPQRIVPIFFSALDVKVAKITRIHDKDQREWDTYIASRERAMIREGRGEA
ncbi:MAG: hypothetical protein ACTTJS_05470 [Wolinella sp.]